MLTAEIAIGTLPAWLTVGGLLLAAWIFYRGGGGTAIHSLQAANQVLDHRVQELETQAKHDAALIAELRARTDVSVQISPLVKWTGEHERRDQERFEKTLAVLDLIAARLGEEKETR